MINIDKAKKYAITNLLNDDLTEVEAVEAYNKNFIEFLFCDGAPINFDEMTIEQLKTMHEKINECVEWVNS